MTYEQLNTQAKEGIIQIVDVRTREEYESGHIPGSIHCDLQYMMSIAEDILKDKNKTYYLYCQTGYRSQIAAMQLNMLGYTDVNDMGGINDWPFEIE